MQGFPDSSLGKESPCNAGDPGFLSPGRGLPLLLIPEYSEINKEQRIPDRSKTAHRKPPVKCFLIHPKGNQP